MLAMGEFSSMLERLLVLVSLELRPWAVFLDGGGSGDDSFVLEGLADCGVFAGGRLELAWLPDGPFFSRCESGSVSTGITKSPPRIMIKSSRSMTAALPFSWLTL